MRLTVDGENGTQRTTHLAAPATAWLSMVGALPTNETASSHGSLDGRIPDGVFDELQRREQPVTMARDFDEMMGHATAIKLHADGTLEGGTDHRGDGAVLGY